MAENTLAKYIVKELENKLSDKEFEMLGRLSKQSFENIVKKIEESIPIPPELRTGA